MRNIELMAKYLEKVGTEPSASHSRGIIREELQGANSYLLQV